MSNVLAGCKRLYLDANILIYWVEANADTSEPIDAAFQEIVEQGITLHTSDITLTECLNGAYRRQSPELVNHYIDLFSQSEFITLVPLGRQLLVDAARDGTELGLKTIDAIHYSSSLTSGCDAILTNDRAFKSSDDMTVIQLSAFKG